MLLHDVVLVVVGQRPHQAEVTDLHSVSRGQQDVPEYGDIVNNYLKISKLTFKVHNTKSL